jgi:hypothetical protein
LLGARTLSWSVSAIATARSTALDAAMPAISVSGAVAIARIARSGARPHIDVLEQVVRKLLECEDVDDVEEQLERGHHALRAGRPPDSDPHRRDPTWGRRSGRIVGHGCYY